MSIREKKTYKVIESYIDDGGNEVIQVINDVESRFPCDYCAIRKNGEIDLFDRTEFYINDKFEFISIYESDNEEYDFIEDGKKYCEMVWYQLEEVK